MNLENNTIRIPLDTMAELTEIDAERNIYVHPNFIGRDIFWQRLELLTVGLRRHTFFENTAIDFGGGSGGYLRGLCSIFKTVEVIDLDPADAERVKQYYTLTNADIIKEDINTWKPANPRDVVIATDVLEHFTDLDIPINIIREYLKPNGLLAISVPTENWIYKFGRILINKTKPKDHYHAGSDIIQRIEELGFKQVWNTSAPHYLGVHIPLFNLAIFKKIAD